MKKCTSFVKKLRSFSDAHADSLIKDIRTLRLTKYISEAVPAICEVTLKVAELPQPAKFVTRAGASVQLGLMLDTDAEFPEAGIAMMRRGATQCHV